MGCGRRRRNRRRRRHAWTRCPREVVEGEAGRIASWEVPDPRFRPRHPSGESVQRAIPGRRCSNTPRGRPLAFWLEVPKYGELERSDARPELSEATGRARAIGSGRRS